MRIKKIDSIWIKENSFKTRQNGLDISINVYLPRVSETTWMIIMKLNEIIEELNKRQT